LIADSSKGLEISYDWRGMAQHEQNNPSEEKIRRIASQKQKMEGQIEEVGKEDFDPLSTAD